MFFHCRNRVFYAGRHLGGGGALYSHLNDSSHASTPHSQGGPQAAQNSANNALNGALSPQEQLLAGTGLGLDPENDPVVFTTSSGLEIKYANAELTNTNLAGYTYFTMGKYNGYDVNWVIIGYDPSMVDYVGDFSGYGLTDLDPLQGENSVLTTIDETPAGDAIRKEAISFLISNLAKPNEEIGDGCVLCLSECTLGTSIFGTNNNNYEGSTLQHNMQKLYDEELNLSKWQKNMIVPQKICNFYVNFQVSVSSNQYIFPMGAEYMNVYEEIVSCCNSTGSSYFGMVDYLSTNALRSSYQIGSGEEIAYLARWGSQTYSTDVYIYWATGGPFCKIGSFGDHRYVTTEFGRRPAFVLKI